MLYSKTWDKPVKTPEELMDLPNIIKWLEQQPFYKGYVYWNGGGCLLAKYYKAHGYSDTRVSPSDVYLTGKYSGPSVPITEEVNYVLLGSTSFAGWRTFKGALRRAGRVLTIPELAHAL